MRTPQIVTLAVAAAVFFPPRLIDCWQRAQPRLVATSVKFEVDEIPTSRDNRGRVAICALGDEHHSQGKPVAAWLGHQQRAALRRLTRRPTMTALLTRTIRQALLVAAFAVSATALSTPSYAFSAESKQMCMGDVFSLCGSEIPNVARVTACMISKRSVVSAGCRTAMDHELGQRPAKVAMK